MSIIYYCMINLCYVTAKYYFETFSNFILQLLTIVSKYYKSFLTQYLVMNYHYQTFASISIFSDFCSADRGGEVKSLSLISLARPPNTSTLARAYTLTSISTLFKFDRAPNKASPPLPPDQQFLLVEYITAPIRTPTIRYSPSPTSPLNLQRLFEDLPPPRLQQPLLVHPPPTLPK